MPNYIYECKNCGARSEVYQSIKDDSLTYCKECDTESLQRVITGGTGIIFTESFKGHHDKIKKENNL
jgi:putative FmdB family regulatory protein